MKENRRINIQLYLGLSILLLLTIGIIINFGLLYFESDTACVNVYIREELRELRYFPSNWYNGEEILLLTPHTFMIPLAAFGMHAYTSRTICDIIILILLVASLFHFANRLFSSKTIAALTTLITVANFSTTFIVYLDCQASYSVIVIICCIALTLFVNAIDDELKLRNVYMFGLFAFANIFCSMMGFRFIQILGFPLAASLFYVVSFEDFLQTSDITIFDKEKSKNTVLLIAGIILSTAIGYYLFMCLSANMTISGDWGGSKAITNIKLVNIDQLDEKVFYAIESYIALSGYQQGIRLLSIKSIISISRTIIFLLMTIVFPLKLLKQYKSFSPKIKVFYIFSWLNFVIPLIIIVLTNLVDGVGSDRYFLVSAVFLWMFGCYYLYKKYRNKQKLLQLAIAALLVVMVLNALSVFHYEKKPLERTVKRYDEVISCLEEENLSHGYATYWNSHNYTVYSDFQTEIIPVFVSDRKITPFRMLAKKSPFKENYYEGKTFLMLTPEEDQLFENRINVLGKEIKRIKLKKDYIVYVYDYNICKVFNKKR